MPVWLSALTGGLLNGVGQAIGAAAGKAIQWIPAPGAYRRGKIHELTNQMVTLQNKQPFDANAYYRLRQQRDKLELDAQNAGQ